MDKKTLKIVTKILTIILLLCFLMSLIADYINVYRFGSAPFYIYIIVRGIEFILPIIVLNIVVSIIARRKKDEK